MLKKEEKFYLFTYLRVRNKKNYIGPELADIAVSYDISYLDITIFLYSYLGGTVRISYSYIIAGAKYLSY